MSQSPATTRVEFIEGLGIAAQEEGMSRISGRIMGLLMSGVSARATETAQWLKKIADRLNDDDQDRLKRVRDHAAF